MAKQPAISNLKELVDGLGVSRVQVWRLVQKGMPTDSLENAKQWRLQHLPPKTGARKVVNEVSRLRKAQADLAELQALEKGGAVAPLEEYRADTMAAMQILATQLQGLPARVAGELAGMTDPALIRRYLADEIIRVRNAVAEALARWTQEGVAHRGGRAAGQAAQAPGPMG